MNTSAQYFPKRVLMTADTVGGVWTYSLTLARELERHGVEIALAAMGAPLTAAQKAEVASLQNVKIFDSAWKLEWMDEPWDDVAGAGEWLLEIEDETNPDIIHLNGFSHGVLPFRAPKLVVGHSCVLSWWRAVKDCDAPPEWNVYRDTVTEGIQLADLVVAPSRAMLGSLHTHYGPFPAGCMIPNGISPDAFSRQAKEDFVFAAGRVWDEAKNLSALAEIAPRLPWPVCIAGDTTAPGKPGGARSFSENTLYIGRLERNELRPWFERAAIYTLPARYEPFGLSVLEAAFAGCALVLGDIPSLRENWDSAALFVSPADSGALADAARRLISNPKLLAEYSARASEQASQFTAKRMADDYLGAYARAHEIHSAKKSRAQHSIRKEHLAAPSERSPLDIERSRFTVFQEGVPQCAS